MNDHPTRRKHGHRHNEHLLQMGVRNGFCAARNGVNQHDTAHQNISPVDVPAQNSGQNDGGRVDGKPRGEPARNQKQNGGKNPNAGIKAVFQKFVGRKNFEFMKNRHERNAQNNHGQRQTKIELHEAHSIGKTLAWRRQKSDGTGLRGHHRQTNVIPRQRLPRQQVIVHVLLPTAAIDAV